MSKRKCEQKINDLLNLGGEIISDKSEGPVDFMARTVQIQLGNCQFKFGYMILGDKEVVVQQLCTCSCKYDCQNSLNWNIIPSDCSQIQK